MIALLLGVLMFGVLRIAAFYAVVAVGALMVALSYWSYRLIRFVVLAFVHAGVDLCRFARGRRAHA